MQGIVSEQCDVFSFGVLLIEIVCGRRNTSIFEDRESLTLIGSVSPSSWFRCGIFILKIDFIN
jgi:hypothetical protein